MNFIINHRSKPQFNARSSYHFENFHSIHKLRDKIEYFLAQKYNDYFSAAIENHQNSICLAEQKKQIIVKRSIKTCSFSSKLSFSKQCLFSHLKWVIAVAKKELAVNIYVIFHCMKHFSEFSWIYWLVAKW